MMRVNSGCHFFQYAEFRLDGYDWKLAWLMLKAVAHEEDVTMGHAINFATLKDKSALAAPCASIPANRRCEHDILLEREDNDYWVVTMISPRAMDWAKSELCCPLRPCFAGSMRLDIISTDRLLKQAHVQGLRTEFVGLGGKDLF
ncbi:hypothetical protein QD460_30705 [Rhizobium jaguaris]|uniref:hypothetical protein n=1 Tax=Rhizobium jaguaris TaxID=1312183 RepID=UPI0039BF6064